MTRSQRTTALLALALLSGPVAAASVSEDTLRTSPDYDLPQVSPELRESLTTSESEPEITGYRPEDCVEPGGRLEILGRDLGDDSGRGVALGGHGLHLDLPVSSWSATSIVASVPEDSRLSGGERYYVGVERSDHSEWLSNIDRRLTICAGAAEIADDPAAGDEPAGPEPSGGERRLGGGDAGSDPAPQQPRRPLPAGRGSLMDGGLPEPPPGPAAVAERDDGGYEPGEVAAVSGDMEAARALAQAAGRLGLEIRRRHRLGNLGMVLTVFRTPAGMRVPEAVRRLQEAAPDAWLDANHRFRFQAGDAPRRYLHELLGWRGRCTGSVRLGMVDTAVATDHPALAGARMRTRSFLPAGVSAAEVGHGTAIAALLVGREDGLLSRAELFAAEVFRSRDEETDTTAELVAVSLDWLLGQGAAVLNLSLGGPRNRILEIAVQRAAARGALLVAAAGNNGEGGAPVYPAAQPEVVAVTAVDANGKVYRHANRDDYIDFAAPGVDLWAAGSYRSGTSYAAPIAAAVLAAQGADLGRDARVNRVRGNVRDLGGPGRDRVFGWGLVQAPPCAAG